MATAPVITTARSRTFRTLVHGRWMVTSFAAPRRARGPRPAAPSKAA
jgi:hypothetical protein